MDKIHTNSNPSMEAFITILNNMDVQLMVADLETDEILYSNNKMNRAYNVDYNPVGKHCWEVYQTDKITHCDFCPLAELRKKPGEPIEWEMYNSATGRWFRNISSIVEWTDGRLVHFEQCVDITQSKQITDILHTRLEQQELLNKISQDLISNIDAVTFINNALEMTGKFLNVDCVVVTRIANEDVVSDYSWYSNPQFERERYALPAVRIKNIKRFYAQEKRNYVSCDNVENDSTFIVMQKNGISAFISVPIYIEQTLCGAMTFEMCSTSREWSENDISFCRTVGNIISGVIEREKIQLDMREAEERMQLMLDTTPLACTFFDEDGSLIDCNEEAPRQYGIPSKQEYLDMFFKLCPKIQPDGVPSIEKAEHIIKKAFESGKEKLEWMHLHMDGSEIPTEVTLIRVKWRGGYRLAGYARDLRELKARMKEIEKTQEALKKAKNKAEENTRAKSDFLSNMSHEIRTPMNAIIGMVGIAKGTEDIERIRYCLDKVSDAANHLLGVINDILDMSKIEAGKFEISPSDFPLEKLLQQVSNVTNFRVSEKRQEFVIKIDKDVPGALVTDQQRLAQVITNLLSNAGKFTPEDGKISLLIHKQEDLGDECILLFEVIDNGIGISKEQQQKLFRSFEQADGSISRRFGGTGLGLAISKNIAEKLGGCIGVESEPQKGSRFYFTIRARKGISNYKSALNPDVDWGNVNILVVDDEKQVREYFEDIAASAGIKCTTSVDGYDACKLLEHGNDYQIMFVDWKMPGMDGIELTRQIRKKYGENVVIIMISAVDWDSIKNAADDAGVNDFVGKPLLPSSIVDSINKYFSQQNYTQTSQKAPLYNGIFKGKCVLLAEDIDINREIIIALLEETEAEIECAENGREVYDMFVANPERYDMILMDVHMPEMDGYEATRLIRSIGTPAAMNLPILAMTANVFREDIERCLTAGMDDHIGKPIDTDEFFNKMRRHL